MYFGWMANDRSGKVLPIVNALNGSGFTGGDETLSISGYWIKLEIEKVE